MSQWIEVSLTVDGEAAEAVADLLQRYGHQGVAVEQNDVPPETWSDDEVEPPQTLTVRAYFPADERAEDTKFRLETALGHMHLMYPMPIPIYQVIDEEDWAEAWKANYHPIRVGQRLLIRPEWIDVAADLETVVIALDPGMAFGTGTHPTTQLCLESLEAQMQPGMQVLDLGCGSGILAIAAAKLGAAHVLALDTDPIAVTSTEQNSARNATEAQITAQAGSLDQLEGQQFDLIVVNILARIIIMLCEQGLGNGVRPGGLAIFSGIIEDQAAEVEAALRATGLEPVQRRQQGDWVAIEARRPV
jgi:ribosomal protein L11 methyltransferase